MNTQSRTIASITNIIYGILSQILVLLLGFAGRTIFIHYLSVEYLGINGLFSNILTILSLADLGLGTGVIVTEDGYILSNAHVTGERFSKCYITLENGKNYEGFVVWSDTDLDLSITKIEAKNLKYAKLGDSGNIRVRRKCVCNRKSYRV